MYLLNFIITMEALRPTIHLFIQHLKAIVASVPVDQCVHNRNLSHTFSLNSNGHGVIVCLIKAKVNYLFILDPENFNASS